MQRKHAPSSKKRKQPEQNSDKGKEKELIQTDADFDAACNMALDDFQQKTAGLDQTADDLLMSDSEGESQEFVPETPEVVQPPAKKVRRSPRLNAVPDLDLTRHVLSA